VSNKMVGLTQVRIFLAETDAVEVFAEEIAEMLAVLGLEPDSYWVSDETLLSDFSTCCPDSVDLESESMADSWEDLRDRWEVWARQEFPRRFPDLTFEEDFLRRPLVNLARRLRESREAPVC